MRLKYKMAVQQVAGFWAAVPVGEDSLHYNGVMSLNETAKDMIELLNNDTTEDQIVADLLKEYDVEEAELRQHVAEFLQKLRDEHLLIEP